MTFLNPLVLTGLAAASIPLILHLLNLRKLKQIDFSTLKFIKELQKTRLRKLRIKRIILLILRTLLIVFAVLAFARPTIDSSLPLPGTYARTSAVILLDNSFSMDVSDEYGNRFNQARSAATTIMNMLKEGDNATVLPLTESNSDERYRLTRNFQFLLENLSQSVISPKTANIEQNLRRAYSVLEESDALNKEIYIISDAQDNVFQNSTADSLKNLAPDIPVYFVHIGGQSTAEIQNISIDSIALVSRIFQKEKPVEIEATIKNNSLKDASGVLLSLYFNGRRASQRTIDLPAGQAKTVTISDVPQEYGAVKAYVEIESDALEADNRRYVGFIIPEKPAMAVVGRPDITRFITLALDPPQKIVECPARIETFSPNQFAGINLNSFEIVLLAGGPYYDNDFKRLLQYVRDGGSVIIFADDETNPEAFSANLASLGFSSLTKRDFPKDRPATFTSVDRVHSLFEGVFKGTTEDKNIVESPRIFKALTTQGGLGIIEIPGGYFLSESHYGEGNALYCAVSPMVSWSSFPFTGIFPTFLYRSVLYMSSTKDFGATARPGERLNFTLPKKYSQSGNFKINDPEGNEFFASSVDLPSGAVLTLDNLDVTGNYLIYSKDSKPAAIVSVNSDPSESNLAKNEKEQIVKRMKARYGSDLKIEVIDELQNLDKEMQKARTGSELWQFFILLALICAVAELLVARNSKSEMAQQ